MIDILYKSSGIANESIIDFKLTNIFYERQKNIRR
jgi:hypothetical protein